MTVSMSMILILIGLVFLMTICSVFIGGWLVFKATGRPGEGGLFSPRPKGEVFTVPDVNDLAPFPEEGPNEEEKHVLKRTKDFLDNLGSQEEKA